MAEASPRKAQAQIAIGMLALVFASIALTRFHSDFLAGFGTGIGVSLLVFGVRAVTRR
jgi:multisubunit Na+/H+ antiporter MnhG subunit